MKKIIYCTICCYMLIAFTTGCYKMGKEISQPGFSVTTETGDTIFPVNSNVRFLVTGNPPLMTFYSGEDGKRFEYATPAVSSGTTYLSFTSALANAVQAGSLSVLISNDFAGTGANDSTITATNINKATWTDITSRALWPTAINTSRGSGNINLSDFNSKPVYIAFKYHGSPGSVQAKWTITNFLVTHVLNDSFKYVINNVQYAKGASSFVLANHTNTSISNYGIGNVTYSPGWIGRNIVNMYKWAIATNNLVITGATTAASATEAESWGLTGPIDLNAITPNYGLGIKTQSAPISDYTYRYVTPGKYVVSFVGGAANVYETAEPVLKQIRLTIKP